MKSPHLLLMLLMNTIRSDFMKNIKKKWILIILSAILIGAVGSIFIYKKYTRNYTEQSIQKVEKSGERNNNMMSGMMGNEQNLDLKPSKQSERQLLIPPVLETSSQNEEEITYDIVAREGEFQIKDGEKTETLGYNGEFLGPVLRMKKGQKVTINTTNQLASRTSFHWHGLKIPSDVDGGPHQTIESGEKKSVTFEVKQEASTLWFHPHPEGETASQVYKGLAGLMYVEDENSKSLNLPENYGIDDIPLIVQDKSFKADNQIDYENDYNSDGTQGDTLLTNGTINPYVEVNNRWMRYRIVSGSNSRTFTFSLDSNEPFYQVATDGGFLNTPVKLNSLTLSPGERAEILVDTKKYNNGDTIKLLANDSVALNMRIRGRKTDTTFIPSKKLNDINTIDEKSLEGLNRQIINLKGMSHMVNINNKQFDMNRIDLYKKLNEQEIWEVNNYSSMMGEMAHPFHIHGVQFQIISRNGKQPRSNENGWKDTVLVNPEERVELLVRFDHAGTFMYHCHILEHEEYGMMGQMEVR